MAAPDKRALRIAQTVIAEMDYVDAMIEERARKRARRSWGEASYAVEGELNRIESEIRAARAELMREPFIAYVRAGQDGGDRVLLFCRNYTPECNPSNSAVEYVSYLAPVGEVASRVVGSHVTVQTPRGGRRLELLEKDVFRPRRKGAWDAIENEIDFAQSGHLQVESLRNLLPSGAVAAIPTDIEQPVTPPQFVEAVGVARPDLEEIAVPPSRRLIRVAEAVKLRDQPVLDSVQDPIFRLPVNSRLIVTGAPGTGKTTLLIKRISQKTKMEFLRLDERAALSSGQIQELLEEHKSWVLFTPTELLRDYLKEALGKEGLPATSATVRIWDDERMILGRDVLRILHAGKRGYFRHAPSSDSPYRAEEAAAVLDSFDEFFAAYHAKRNETRAGRLHALNADTESAITASTDEDSPLNQRVVRLAGKSHRLSLFVQEGLTSGKTALETSAELAEAREEAMSIRDDLTNLKSDLANEIVARVPKIAANVGPVLETSRNRVIDAIDELYVHPSNRRPGREEGSVDSLRELIIAAIKDSEYAAPAHALQVASVVVEELIASVDTVESVFTSIPRIYNRFRKERYPDYSLDVSDSEEAADESTVDDDAATRVPKQMLSNSETDLLIYVGLRMAHKAIPLVANKGIKARTLARIQDRYRSVVSVDEAADFSWIQLGCMYYLADPAWRSFAMCGDLMQRVTDVGLRRWDECKRFAPDVHIVSLSIAYRQSRTLLQIARRMYAESLGEEPPFESPYTEETEPSPLIHHASTLPEVTRWIAERIVEIYTIYDSLPTIAVFVASDSEIDSVTNALRYWLDDNAIPVEACKDGKVLGEGQRVRVFAVEHIKGLEFQGVFLVGFDRMHAESADLAEKYLYVGLSRAIMFLGLTVEAEFPHQLSYIQEEFVEGDWQAFVPAD